MSQYDNTNRGVLFDNDRKETDNHPDMTGTLNINGIEHWFSGWWKEGRDGSEFLSLSIGKPKEQRAAQRPVQSQDGRPSRRQAAPAARPAPAQQSSGFADFDDAPF
jgi:hypothetical protein